MDPTDPTHPPRSLAGCQLVSTASRLVRRHAVVVAAAAAAGCGGAERSQRGEWRADTAGFAVSTHAIGGWVPIWVGYPKYGDS